MHTGIKNEKIKRKEKEKEKMKEKRNNDYCRKDKVNCK